MASTSFLTVNGEKVEGPILEARLAPGAGQKLVIKMKRYANEPKLAFPWD
ncbi:MAG: hypothetical protein KatS3mg105_0090 [Gemmatales bacterium]|nr:MAG: hypothetical protein KatS3mg105_0090 [Gemmatales bacterium]